MPSAESIPRIDLSTGSGLPVAALDEDGATAEKAAALFTREANTRAIESFMIVAEFEECVFWGLTNAKWSLVISLSDQDVVEKEGSNEKRYTRKCVYWLPVLKPG